MARTCYIGNTVVYRCDVIQDLFPEVLYPPKEWEEGEEVVEEGEDGAHSDCDQPQGEEVRLSWKYLSLWMMFPKFLVRRRIKTVGPAQSPDVEDFSHPSTNGI